MTSKGYAQKSVYPLLMFLLALAMSCDSCKKKRDIWEKPYTQQLKNVSDDAFGLIVSSNVEGYVEPCGCTSNPLGGISRYATVFNDVKAALKERVFFFDTGNLLFEFETRNDADKCQDDARIDLLVGSLSDLGLQFTIPGALDNARGEAYRDQVYQKHNIAALPFLSLKRIKAPGFEVGVIAVPPDANKEQLIEIIKKAREESSIKALVAVSKFPPAQTKALFDTLDVDFVIEAAAISSTEPKNPVALNSGALYLELGRQGQYFNVLLLQNLSKRKNEPIELDTRAFENNARIELLTTRVATLTKQLKEATKERASFLQQRIDAAKQELNTLSTQTLAPLPSPHMVFITVALTKKINPEPRVDNNLLAYEKNIPVLVKKCEENIQCPKPEPNAAVFVGATTCKNCHEEAYKVWQNAVFEGVGLDEDGKEIRRMVGHSKAWKTLVDDNKDADRSCIGCHSVGFMEKGGYCKAFEVDFRKDVQCESCHGAGSLHAKTGDKKLIRRQVPEETCRSCHHVPHIPSFESFNYNEKVVKILGKGHGENLLKQLTHAPKE